MNDPSCRLLGVDTIDQAKRLTRPPQTNCVALSRYERDMMLHRLICSARLMVFYRSKSLSSLWFPLPVRAPLRIPPAFAFTMPICPSISSSSSLSSLRGRRVSDCRSIALVCIHNRSRSACQVHHSSATRSAYLVLWSSFLSDLVRRRRYPRSLHFDRSAGSERSCRDNWRYTFRRVY